MKVIDVEQGSQEWLNIRLGLISASRFKDIMTEPKAKADREAGKISQTSLAYMNELIAEILTGESIELSTRATEWGNGNEDRALTEYCFENDVQITGTGIIISDCGFYGASPDGLIALSDKGMQEVKCPFNSKNHISNCLYGMDKQHIPQVQGNMWINGREWCDFISYDPRILGKGRLYVERIKRDNDYIEKLAEKVENFRIQMCKVLKESFAVDWQGVTIEA